MADAYIKGFKAAGALSAYHLLAFDGTGQLLHATGANALIGVATEVNAELGTVADAILGGPAEVKLGGTVAAGDALTSDANGQAIVAAPAIGATVRCVGHALSAGVAGDVIYAHVSVHDLTRAS